MKIPVDSAGSLHRKSRTVPPALPYEGSQYTTCGISWVLPHFVPFSHTARSLCFSSYITAEQNNSGEGFKSSWTFDSRSAMSADLWFHDSPIKETLFFSARPLDYFIFQPWLPARALSAYVFFVLRYSLLAWGYQRLFRLLRCKTQRKGLDVVMNKQILLLLTHALHQHTISFLQLSCILLSQFFCHCCDRF